MVKLSLLKSAPKSLPNTTIGLSSFYNDPRRRQEIQTDPGRKAQDMLPLVSVAG